LRLEKIFIYSFRFSLWSKLLPAFFQPLEYLIAERLMLELMLVLVLVGLPILLPSLLAFALGLLRTSISLYRSLNKKKTLEQGFYNIQLFNFPLTCWQTGWYSACRYSACGYSANSFGVRRLVLIRIHLEMCFISVFSNLSKTKTTCFNPFEFLYKLKKDNLSGF